MFRPVIKKRAFQKRLYVRISEDVLEELSLLVGYRELIDMPISEAKMLALILSEMAVYDGVCLLDSPTEQVSQQVSDHAFEASEEFPSRA